MIVGISGLRWNLRDPGRHPGAVAAGRAGSVGSLVDYAQQPLACPADGWLTLNAAARAQGPRPCATLPAVVPRRRRRPRSGDAADRRATTSNSTSRPTGACSARWPAARPPSAPAPRSRSRRPSGTVSSYLPSPCLITPAVLARCPLTVIDLGALELSERTRRLPPTACSPASWPTSRRTPCCWSPRLARGALGGSPAPAGPVVVSGPGFADGLLRRHVHQAAGNRHAHRPDADGGRLARPRGARRHRRRADRRAASGGTWPRRSASCIGRDTAEQVWIGHPRLVLHRLRAGGRGPARRPRPDLLGRDPARRRRRARCWRVAGVFAAAVPARHVPGEPGPVVAARRTRRVAVRDGGRPGRWWSAAAALRGTVASRTPLGPFGAICLATLAVLGLDVMTGSRLQLETPFGLSLLVCGRFYGIGNDVLGVYCVSDAGRGRVAGQARRGHGGPAAVLAAAAVGLFAVVASGWPGFGAKVGGTIALVPCLLLLILRLAGIRVGWRWAVPIAVSGLALFAVFALVSYFFPAAGVSDIGHVRREPAARPGRRPARSGRSAPTWARSR